MFAGYCCVALLALSFSLTAAADEPDCAELTKPTEDRSKVLGKWIWVSGTNDCEDNMKELKSVNSSWIELISTSDTGDMLLRYGDKVDGKCYLGSANTTFDGNVTTATFYLNNTARVHSGRHLKTCPDCLVWEDSMTKDDGQACRSVYLFSKNGTVDAADQEVFKQQVGCLNFTSELLVLENSILCPDEKDAEADGKKDEQ